MSRRRKRLERIRQNVNNVSLVDLRHVLEDYGFEYRKTVGSHYTFTYVLGGETRLFVVPFRRPLKSIYVRRALRMIDEIIQEQGDDESDNTESDE